MTNLLTTLLNNKHTSGAGAAYLAMKAFGKICEIWWPAYKAQIDGTLDVLEGLAVAYGLVMAGDGSQSAKSHEETKSALSELQQQVSTTAQAVATGDTSLITRAQVSPLLQPPTNGATVPPVAKP